MSTTIELPERIKNLIGGKIIGSGHMFTKNYKWPKGSEFEVLDAKMTDTTIDCLSADKSTIDKSYPCFKLLLKGEGMSKAIWSTSYPILEINLLNK